MKLYKLLLLIVVMGIICSVLFPTCVGPYTPKMSGGDDFDYRSQTLVSSQRVKQIYALARKHHHRKVK